MKKRLYSYFEKENGKWVRKSMFAFTLASARRVFQDKLLSGSFAGKTVGLRAVDHV